MLKRITAIDNKSGNPVVREGQRFNTVATMVTNNGRVSAAMNNVVLRNPDPNNVKLANRNRKASQTGPEVFNKLQPEAYGMHARYDKALKEEFNKHKGGLEHATGMKGLKFETIQERSLKHRVASADTAMDKARLAREKHAEMQLVTRFDETKNDDRLWGGKEPRILGLAANKVACARCHGVIKDRGIPHTGPAGKDFPNWVPPAGPSQAGSVRRPTIGVFRPQDAAPPTSPTNPRNEAKSLSSRHLNNKKSGNNYSRYKNKGPK